MVCQLTRERKQRKNQFFIFKSVFVRLRESVGLGECVNTEFDWEVKQGFEKASVSRAVRLQRVTVRGYCRDFSIKSGLRKENIFQKLCLKFILQNARNIKWTLRAKTNSTNNHLQNNLIHCNCAQNKIGKQKLKNCLWNTLVDPSLK